MNIYVKSRGVSKGYSWVNQNEEIDNPPSSPKELKLYIVIIFPLFFIVWRVSYLY